MEDDIQELLRKFQARQVVGVVQGSTDSEGRYSGFQVPPLRLHIQRGSLSLNA